MDLRKPMDQLSHAHKGGLHYSNDGRWKMEEFRAYLGEKALSRPPTEDWKRVEGL